MRSRHSITPLHGTDNLGMVKYLWELRSADWIGNELRSRSDCERIDRSSERARGPKCADHADQLEQALNDPRHARGQKPHTRDDEDHIDQAEDHADSYPRLGQVARRGGQTAAGDGEQDGARPDDSRDDRNGMNLKHGRPPGIRKGGATLRGPSLNSSMQNGAGSERHRVALKLP